MLPMFMAAVDQTIVATALPAIGATLGDIERVSWVVVAYLVANTIAAPVYGRLGDALGRRRMMFGALGVFVAASLFCAASTSVLMLSFARLLQGLGGGGLMTLSQALIAEAVPPRQRGRYQGYLSGMYAAAATFGPVVGGWLTEHYGWRSVFLVNLPLGALAVALVARLPAQPVRGGRLQFDVWGTVLFAAVIAPTLLALERAQRFEPQRPAAARDLWRPGGGRHRSAAAPGAPRPLPAVPSTDVPQARHMAHRPAGRLRRGADRLHGELPADVPAGRARPGCRGLRPAAAAPDGRSCHGSLLAGRTIAGPGTPPSCPPSAWPSAPPLFCVALFAPAWATAR